MTILLLALIVFAFVMIVIEDVVHVNKAKSTLFIGTLVWILAFIFPEQIIHEGSVQEKLNENLLEIATLWLFLMAAMTYVAYLNQKGLITQLVYRVLPDQITQRKLMLLMAMLALFFSSLADNITASLIMLSLLASLNLEKKDLLKFATLLVFAVNSGGVALITGDVTTLMIFLADKVEILDLFLLIPPAIIGVAVLALCLMSGSNQEFQLPRFRRPISGRDKVIGALFLLTILTTLSFSTLYQIPPLLTFLFGLSVMFLVHQILHKKDDDRPNILEYIRDIEFDTLLFFLGVLLLVGMLKELSVLDHLPELYNVLPIAMANYIVGLLSALVDNVPLTAAILKSGVAMNKAQWLGLTYATGVGGSILIIGSAAGVIAMSKMKELTFLSYMRFIHWLLVAYTSGYVCVLLAGSLLS
ncbi:sodium:proton antiporter NhaD [Pontibacterium granulatum]|uniref:sodium:proton antiporter NhaD n=1 Tax=Pontibacterium granulatum TaxID=2036029 RepID=UPI00249C5467|nr:sodium:proton antiporter NhaD [Pontibacterium granulatum]MDI3324238.1 sodium:proton antiporter NhaD [Pontibacterium granulatum]